MESNKTGPPPDTEEEHVRINKFRTGRETETTNNAAHRKFAYRREIQCDCCHTFGHNVDEDICRIGAQVYHSTQFIKNNPKKADNNAKAFMTANNKNEINAVESAFPEFFKDISSENEFDQKILTLATLIQSPEDPPWEE